MSTLDRSVDRINAVAEQAEAERQKKLDVQREKVKEYEKRTGKRRRVDERDAGSGKAGVEVLIRPEHSQPVICVTHEEGRWARHLISQLFGSAKNKLSWLIRFSGSSQGE